MNHEPEDAPWTEEYLVSRLQEQQAILEDSWHGPPPEEHWGITKEDVTDSLQIVDDFLRDAAPLAVSRDQTGLRALTEEFFDRLFNEGRAPVETGERELILYMVAMLLHQCGDDEANHAFMMKAWLKRAEGF